MSEIRTQVQQVTSTIEKAIVDQASRIEDAIGEVNKLQTDALSQAKLFMEKAVRLTNEQLVFADQVAGEWRKQVLTATRNAAEAFALKKE